MTGQRALGPGPSFRGFTVGEGSFMIKVYNKDGKWTIAPSFIVTIYLHKDDAPLIYTKKIKNR